MNWACTIYVERRKGCEDGVQPIEQCEYGQCWASGFRNPNAAQLTLAMKTYGNLNMIHGEGLRCYVSTCGEGMEGG